MNSDLVENYFAELSLIMNSPDRSKIVDLTKLLRDVKALESKVIIAGNGGSAGIASHVATDLNKTLQIKSLTFHDPALITCYANDYGYDQWLKKAIESFAEKGDLVILISSSGKSPNMINAAKFSKEMGLKTVTLTGFNPENPLRQMGDINLWAPSEKYNHIENTHQFWLLCALDLVKKN